jgi:hypothetical protein
MYEPETFGFRLDTPGFAADCGGQRSFFDAHVAEKTGL